MRRGTVVAAAWATLLFTWSCENRPPVAPSADDPASASAPRALSGAYNLSATALGPSTIALTWEDNSGNESGFEIFRSTTGAVGSFALLGVAAADATNDVDTSVPPASVYCYRVRAFRKVGKKTTYAEFSNTACARTSTLPPSNTSATPSSSSSVVISWKDNDAATNDAFRIERASTPAGPWEVLATAQHTQTSFGDEGRISDQQVCYRIIAVSSDTESAPSNVDCTAPPRAPTDLRATSTGPTIELVWQDNSTVETVYWVERSDDGVTFAAIAALSANSVVFGDASTGTNTTYWYRVRARKDGGSSDASNVVSAMRSCTPTSASEDVCDDGVDNDCDDLFDLYDPDCEAPRCDWDQCPPGYQCGYDGFCVPHCGNGARDGDEGDVDCGGSCSEKCQAGQHCWSAWDCASGLCISGVCQPAGGQQ